MPLALSLLRLFAPQENYSAAECCHSPCGSLVWPCSDILSHTPLPPLLASPGTPPACRGRRHSIGGRRGGCHWILSLDILRGPQLLRGGKDQVLGFCLFVFVVFEWCNWDITAAINTLPSKYQRWAKNSSQSELLLNPGHPGKHT